jgi:hypothetical protein
VERSHSSLLIWRVVILYITCGGESLFTYDVERSLFTFEEE